MSETTHGRPDTTAPIHGYVPGTDIPWEDTPVDGLPVGDDVATAVTWPRGQRVELKSTVRGRSHSIDPNVFALVLDGADEYNGRYGDKELPVPKYYNRIEDEAETYVSSTSALGHDYGRGITPARLEDAIRLATGEGAYRADELTITACGEHPFLIETADNAYLMAPGTIREYDSDEVISEREAAGMTITQIQRESLRVYSWDVRVSFNRPRPVLQRAEVGVRICTRPAVDGVDEARYLDRGSYWPDPKRGSPRELADPRTSPNRGTPVRDGNPTSTVVGGGQ